MGVTAIQWPNVRGAGRLARLGPVCLAVLPMRWEFGQEVADTPIPRTMRTRLCGSAHDAVGEVRGER